jgi:hypothetical protein
MWSRTGRNSQVWPALKSPTMAEKGAHEIETRMTVTLRDGRSYDTSNQEVTFKPEGVEIILAWRETPGTGIGQERQTRSKSVFHPWNLVDTVTTYEVIVWGGKEAFGESLDSE